MMKCINVIACLVFVCGCSEDNKYQDSALSASCEKLSTLINNKTSDTSLLKENMEFACALANKYANARHDSLIAVTARLLGNAFLGADKFSDARFYYQKGLRIGARHLKPEADIITRLYRNTALTYYNANDFKNALVYFDSVKIISEDKSAQLMKIQTKMNIAECYEQLNDYKSSERIFQETLISAETYYTHEELASFHNRYADCLRKAKKFQAAIDKTDIAFKLLQPLEKGKKLSKQDTVTLADNHYTTAYILYDSGVYKPSETYYLRAMSLYKNIKDLRNQKRTLSNMSSMYRFDKQFNKAQKTLSEGIALFNQSELNDKDVRLKASFFVNRSEVYLETKQYKKALADHDSAIYYFSLYEKRPSLTAVMLQARPVLLSVLSDKAKAHIALAENGSDTEGYQKALKLTQQIIEIADDIRADYFSEDAKLTLANDIKPALERAIGVCQKLYMQTNDKQYLHQAFGFVEYSRSMVLYENARLDNQLPPHLKAENEALKQQEAALIAKNNVEALQNYLRLKRQFREKIKTLNRNQLAAVADLQAALIKDDKTVFVEYFVGDSTIFTFTLFQNDVKLNASPTPKDFDQQIQNLRNEITKRKPVDDARVFVQQTNALYALLLDKTLAQCPATIHQLIIAPDGVLNYLPFDILIKGDPSVNSKDFKDSDFLLRQYTLSYAYSANLLLEQKRVKKTHNKAFFAGFAAKYGENEPRLLAAIEPEIDTTRGSSSDLKWAREEVETISTMLGGDAFISEQATETTFKKVANHYRILHFAMHGLVDNEDPALNKLLFTLTPKDTINDNNLTAAELQTMPLNADLAVLSACNTGFGVLRKGEGVMSIARAFTYAGVPATVTSLWSAPDRETSDIMVAFYKNLQKGLSKDAALRQAKLTYLDNASRSKEANPYFWAAFVPIGNMETIDVEKKDPLSIWGILAGLMGVLGLIFWFWKRKEMT